METLNEFGAHQLAARIRAYWASQGYLVTPRVERMVIATNRSARGEALWVVRSDLGLEVPLKHKAVA